MYLCPWMLDVFCFMDSSYSNILQRIGVAMLCFDLPFWSYFQYRHWFVILLTCQTSLNIGWKICITHVLACFVCTAFFNASWTMDVNIYRGCALNWFSFIWSGCFCPPPPLPPWLPHLVDQTKFPLHKTQYMLKVSVTISIGFCLLGVCIYTYSTEQN